MEVALLRNSLFAWMGVLTGIVMLAGAASAQESTEAPPSTQALYDDCVSPDQTRELACVSYLAGVADTMRLIGSGIQQQKVSEASAKEFAGFGICAQEYTGNELRQAFIAWAGRHPEKADKYRLFGAINAFYATWPCKS